MFTTHSTVIQLHLLLSLIFTRYTNTVKVVPILNKLGKIMGQHTYFSSSDEDNKNEEPMLIRPHDDQDEFGGGDADNRKRVRLMDDDVPIPTKKLKSIISFLKRLFRTKIIHSSVDTIEAVYRKCAH